MLNKFHVFGLSHKNAPIHIREKVALNKEESLNLLLLIKGSASVSDVLVLSTCNRTEIYFSSEEYFDSLKYLSLVKGSELVNSCSQYFHLKDGIEAVKHLFRVSIGLEATVIGDMQISNQVKQAYQQTADVGLASPFLHRLLHTIFFTNKRVVQETSLKDGAASVSYAAAELINTLTDRITDPRILLAGVGEIGADVCRNLDKERFKIVTITNRTQHKAAALAAECGYQVAPFDQLDILVKDADVVISSVQAPTPLINHKMVNSFGQLTFKYFIDLSVPRSIASDVEQVSGVIIYNIDSIQSKANEALKKRMAAIPAVELIVDEMLSEFNSWIQEMGASPTIKKLKNALEEIRKEELTRYMKTLSKDESIKLDKITKNIMQKIIKLPVLQLKAACKRGEAENMIGVLHSLFNLDQEKTQY